MSAYTSTAYIDFSTGYVVASESGSNTWSGKSTWGTMTWGNDYHNPMVYYTEPIDVGARTSPYNLNIDSKANGSITYRVLESSTASFITTYDRDPLSVTTYNSISTTTSTVKYGSYSISANGTNQYFTATNSSGFNFGTGTFTIEAWIKPLTTATEQYIYYKGTGTTCLAVYMNFASLAVRFPSGLTVTASNVPPGVITTSTWQHVAVNRDTDGRVTLYKDGYVAGFFTVTQDVSQASYEPIFMKNSTGIGYGTPGQTAYFKGYVDDLRISNTCRYPQGAQDALVFTPPTQLSNDTATVFLVTGERGIVDTPNIVNEVVETDIVDGDSNIPAFTKRYVMVGIEVASSERGVIYSNKITPNQNRLNILLNDVDMTTLANSTTTSTTKVLDLGRETSGILAVFPQKTSGLDDVGINPVVVDKSQLEVAFVKATEGAQDYVYGGTAGAAVNPATMTSPIIDVMVHALPEQYMENGILKTR